MSNSKTAIGEIKKLMVQFGFLTEESKEVRQIFIDAKLVDGTAVKVEGDSLVEGAKVLVITADAEVPAPDGIHEISDGTEIETKDGIIVSVKEDLGEYPEKKQAEMKEPDLKDADVADVKEEAGKEEMQAEVLTLLRDCMEKLGEKIQMLEGKVKDMNSDFSAFKKEPGAKKIADGKTTRFNKMDDNEDSLNAKVASIMSLRNN